MEVKIHENRSKNPYRKLSKIFFEKWGRGEILPSGTGRERFTPHLRMGLLWITHPVLRSKPFQTFGIQISLFAACIWILKHLERVYPFPEPAWRTRWTDFELQLKQAKLELKLEPGSTRTSQNKEKTQMQAIEPAKDEVQNQFKAKSKNWFRTSTAIQRQFWWNWFLIWNVSGHDRFSDAFQIGNQIQQQWRCTELFLLEFKISSNNFDGFNSNLHDLFFLGLTN